MNPPKWAMLSLFKKRSYSLPRLVWILTGNYISRDAENTAYNEQNTSRHSAVLLIVDERRKKIVSGHKNVNSHLTENSNLRLALSCFPIKLRNAHTTRPKIMYEI
jgi:uncharacterized protein YcgI (DUF1989 family)